MKLPTISFVMVLIAPLALLPCVVKNAESSSLPTGTKQQQQTAYQTPTAQASPAASESPLASQAATPDDKTANAPEQSTCRRFFNLLLQFNWSNWAIVLVAIWAALTAKNTLTSIQSQAETAKQDLVITNRAHLYLSEVRITFYEPQNVYEETTTYRFEIVYPIYNGGQTPALYIGSFARTIVAETAPQQISEAATALDKPQSAVVPPRSQEPLRPLYPSWVDKPELDDIRAGKRKLFFYGKLVYRDIFDAERHTRFTLSFSGTPAEEGKFKHMAFESGKGLNWFD
ncbi:hypothetical protein [Candidatus Binatus sp.]|uniref:hypothetical protein n=1 Tax=Candidatus Binatus sp. TaxID=2811406 RepID=UPI003C778F1E